MKFEISDNVLSYLESLDSYNLTIDLKEIPSNCCLGRLPETKVSFLSPENLDNYRHFWVGGIQIHLSKLVRSKETLKVFLSGWGPFKKVEVSGINFIL